MNNINSLIILLVFAGMAATAQDRVKKAIQILDQVKNKTESYESFKADFTYSMTNEEAGINESKHGDILVQKDKYRLAIAGQLVISDGATLWTFIEDEEVQINNIEDTEESITLTNLLESYKENYRSKFMKERLVSGKTIQEIDLTPIEGKTYFKIKIEVDKATSHLISFSIYDKDGSVYAYIIDKFEPNAPVTDSLFVFDPEEYPDIEIVDMR